MADKTLQDLRNELIEFLLTIKVEDGAEYVVDIVAVYIELLVERQGNFVSEEVRQFVDISKLKHNFFGLRYGTEGDRYWTAIFLEFHMRVLRLRIDVDNINFPQRKPEVVNHAHLTEKAKIIAAQLVATGLSIDETLDWLIELCRTWATVYDYKATRQQLARYDYVMKHWDTTQFIYYPIKVIADLTEF